MLHAEDGTWTNQETPGVWGDTANWLDGVIASGAGSAASFSGQAVDVQLADALTIGNLSFADGTGTWNLTGSPITLNGGGSAPAISVGFGTINNPGASIHAVLAGTQGLVKRGDGVLSLTGENAYSGTTRLEGGILSAGSANLNGTLIEFAGGSLRVPGAGASLSNHLSVTQSGTVTFANGSKYLTGAISSEATDVELTLAQSGSTTTTITGNLSGYRGALLLNNGNYRLESGTEALSTGGSVLWNLNESATLFYRQGSNFSIDIPLGGLTGSGTLSGGGTAGNGYINYLVGGRGDDTTFSGAIVDGATKTRLTKVGGGVLELAGNSAYTGITDVQEGTLKVTGNLSGTSEILVGTGSAVELNGGSIPTISIAEGGSLTGNGQIDGNLLLAGNLSSFSLSLAGDLEWLATANTVIAFASGAYEAGSFDLVQALANTATFGGALTLLFDPEQAYQEGTVTVFDFAEYAGDFSEVNVSGLADGQTATFDAATGTVVIGSIPEPQLPAVLAVLGSVLLARFRRRGMPDA